MIKIFQVSGMTCSGCEDKVKTGLLSVSGVSAAIVSKDAGTATVTFSSSVPLAVLQTAITDKYKISSLDLPSGVAPQEFIAPSWFETYRPILLIFGYITLVTLLIQALNGSFDAMVWMRHFMAGFFLVFSFFKLLNLKGFADSYAMYDVIAKKIPAWGYAYAFIELGLGVSYLLNAFPFVTNIVTLVVMSVSILGVLQTVLNKQKIQCACLGAVFNLPMSTVTIIEDGLMIAMSLAMIVMNI